MNKHYLVKKFKPIDYATIEKEYFKTQDQIEALKIYRDSKKENNDLIKLYLAITNQSYKFYYEIHSVLFDSEIFVIEDSSIKRLFYPLISVRGFRFSKAIFKQLLEDKIKTI